MSSRTIRFFSAASCNEVKTNSPWSRPGALIASTFVMRRGSQRLSREASPGADESPFRRPTHSSICAHRDARPASPTAARMSGLVGLLGCPGGPKLRTGSSAAERLRLAVGEMLLDGAVEVAALIRRREVSSVEVVEAFLRRIELVNVEINAVVGLAGERALSEARAVDRSMARSRVAGVFSGVPFTAKDVFETAGVETVAGLRER